MPHDEVQDQLTISQVLDHYGGDTTRVRARGWTTIRCPFHDDRHPSARVSLTKNGFWCPACGVSGDPLKIIMEQEALETRAAANEWARNVLGASQGHVRRADKGPKRKRWSRDLFD